MAKKSDKKNSIFDFVIGNPPYQDDDPEASRKTPLYDKFMDAVYPLADETELITPARFLFEAGQTPKDWNRKILNDEHFKVLHYEPDSSEVFPNAQLTGGVAVTLHSKDKTYDPVQVYTPYKELNSIVEKVNEIEGDAPRFDSIVSSQGIYRFTEVLFKEHPEVAELSGKGTGDKIVSKIVSKATDIFSDTPVEDDFCKILSKAGNGRAWKYIKRKYIQPTPYLDTYNVMISESDGSAGYLGNPIPARMIGRLEIADPESGSVDTYLSVGTFANRSEAENCAKYMQTKFVRVMLGVKKVTQHHPKSTWTQVPLQDFSRGSDIHWNGSLEELDKTLYKKYKLTKKEISFIEKYIAPPTTE